jgi:hypothetical protein
MEFLSRGLEPQLPCISSIGFATQTATMDQTPLGAGAGDRFLDSKKGTQAKAKRPARRSDRESRHEVAGGTKLLLWMTRVNVSRCVVCAYPKAVLFRVERPIEKELHRR